jgi:transposase
LRSIAMSLFVIGGMSETGCSGCEALNALLAASRTRVAELEDRVAELETELDETVKLAALQRADLERYKQAVEASRPNHPERAPRDELQLAFERVLETVGGKPAANDAETNDAGAKPGADTAGDEAERTRPDSKKRRHKHGRRKLDLTSAPVIEQRIEPEEVIASGGEGYECIDEEVTERVAWRPGQWVRYRLIRPKFVTVELAKVAGACSESTSLDAAEPTETDSEPLAAEADSASASAAPDDGSGSEADTDAAPGPTILIAPLPENIWPNFMADPSAIAHVIVSKYGDIVPLNRQETISARNGFALPKSTQCGWLKAAWPMCAPVVDAMFVDGKQNAFIMATDATGARVLPPRRKPGDPPRTAVWPDKRGCENWHVYVFIPDRDHVIFRYHREHTGAVFEEMLRGFRGNLLADAASVFDVLYREHGMIENGCWFHCRRPFYRALEIDPQRAFEALSLIGKLFEIDRELRARELELEAFTRLRAEQARPILKLFDNWIELNRERVDPRGPLASGIGYYTNQREALHRFLDDGRIRLDNNWSEQQLRNLVLGLANWSFFANETGLRWYTTFRSLIASCALHRLNPEVYVEQLLRIVPHWPKHRVLELAPKYWLNTVAELEPRWRKILERPWEPGVVASAEIVPPGVRPADTTERERAA